MNNRVRYTRQSIANNAFYQLPKFLFEKEFQNLSNDARVLYSLLRNRHEISIKNGWYDENGDVFLHFKRTDMQSILKLSDKTVTKAMKDLKSFYLLEEIQQGLSKPNKIYLLSVIIEPYLIKQPEMPENSQTRKIYESGHGEFTSQDTESLRSNHNNSVYNYVNPVQSSPVGQEGRSGQERDMTDTERVNAYTEIIKGNIAYGDFTMLHPFDTELVDEIVMIILDTVITMGRYIKIGGEDKPRELVKAALMKLSYEDVEFVIEQYKRVTTRITKKKQYLLKMLYTVKMERDAHYTNLVESDKWM